jgi:hypothetical protein
MNTPQIGDLWEITVTDPEFTRVHGTTLCHVGVMEGYLCWRRHDTGEFWLDINDSAINSKRLVWRTDTPAPQRMTPM